MSDTHPVLATETAPRLKATIEVINQVNYIISVITTQMLDERTKNGVEEPPTEAELKIREADSQIAEHMAKLTATLLDAEQKGSIDHLDETLAINRVWCNTDKAIDLLEEAAKFPEAEAYRPNIDEIISLINEASKPKIATDTTTMKW